MQLSVLVEYLNLLDTFSRLEIDRTLKEQIAPVAYMVKNHAVKLPDLIQELDQDICSIDCDLDRFVQTIGKLKQRTRELIGRLEPKYLSDSYKLYQDMYSDQTDYVLNRRLVLPPDIINYLRGRIIAGGDWHHAGMILRPGLEDWLDDLVSLDPLYLVDQSHDLLAPVRNKFNETYQRRLRYYVVDENKEHPLTDLPDGQFGFCLAYNFFHYKPFEIIKTYLQDLYQKLAPGGTLSFTFNDCDRTGGVRLTEKFFMCYTPGSLIKAMAVSIGYIITQTYDLDAAAGWIELRKPGTLTSIKGGQCLARLQSKTVA